MTRIAAIRLLLAALAATFLAGCAAFKPQVSEGRLVPPPGTAYAVVAVTLKSFDNITSLPDAALEFTGPAGRHTLWGNTSTAGIVAPGDEPNGDGILNVVALPAGDYVTTRMFGSWMMESAGMRWREYANVPVTARFSLKEGEVVYLGDAHLRLDFRPSVQFSGQQRRDFNHMKVRWGVTDTSNIRIAPLQATAPAAQ